MKRNCNLELQLVTPSVFFHSSDYGGTYMSDTDTDTPNKKQPMTIFYNGMVASCDATELQAKAIISVASGEMEKKMEDDKWRRLPVFINSGPSPTTTGLSMKRSLQRFLEKRKSRAQSLSPYQR